jgi:hypothetical protein
LYLLFGFLLAEALFSIATALLSGSLETWASEPIRKKKIEYPTINHKRVSDAYDFINGKAREAIYQGRTIGSFISLIVISFIFFINAGKSTTGIMSLAYLFPCVLSAYSSFKLISHCRQLRSRIQVFSRGSLSFRDSFFKCRISGA